MDTPILTAINEHDTTALHVLLAADVTFNSPVRSYHGRDDVAHLLEGIGRLLDELRVTRRVDTPDETVLFFVASGGEREIDGVLDERRDAAGKVVELTLMLRPLRELLAAVEQMGKALESAPIPSRR
jgi:hypothetical protein